MLHERNIVYRDLKPENVLLGEDGYITLTDFGLAKILKDEEKAMSFCGTPEYIAPEIILEAGHNKTVDWWTLGIFTYEMITGFPPFITKERNPRVMYDCILHKPALFPDVQHGIDMSDDCKHFIACCLSKNPEKRLGANGDIQEILKHPWLASVDIHALERKQIRAPLVPKLS